MNIFEQAWDFFDKKKVAIGSLLMMIAIVMRNNLPEYAGWADVIEEIGLLLGGIGFAHKAVKEYRGE